MAFERITRQNIDFEARRKAFIAKQKAELEAFEASQKALKAGNTAPVANINKELEQEQARRPQGSEPVTLENFFDNPVTSPVDPVLKADGETMGELLDKFDDPKAVMNKVLMAPYDENKNPILVLVQGKRFLDLNYSDSRAFIHGMEGDLGLDDRPKDQYDRRKSITVAKHLEGTIGTHPALVEAIDTLYACFAEDKIPQVSSLGKIFGLGDDFTALSKMTIGEIGDAIAKVDASNDDFNNITLAFQQYDQALMTAIDDLAISREEIIQEASVETEDSLWGEDKSQEEEQRETIIDLARNRLSFQTKSEEIKNTTSSSGRLAISASHEAQTRRHDAAQVKGSLWDADPADDDGDGW